MNLSFRQALALAALAVVLLSACIISIAFVCYKAGNEQAQIIRDEIRRRTVDPESSKLYQRVAYANDVYGLALKRINDNVDRGYITREFRRSLAPTTQQCGNALDAAQMAANTRNEQAGNEQLKQFKNSYEELLLKAGISPDALPPCEPLQR